MNKIKLCSDKVLEDAVQLTDNGVFDYVYACGNCYGWGYGCGYAVGNGNFQGGGDGGRSDFDWGYDDGDGCG